MIGVTESPRALELHTKDAKDAKPWFGCPLTTGHWFWTVLRPPIPGPLVRCHLPSNSLFCDSLCRHEDQIQSPPWHEEILREREKRVSSGQETFIDWESAKKELRDRLT